MNDMACITLPTKGNTVFVNVGNQPCKTLCDTGATISAVRENVLKGITNTLSLEVKTPLRNTTIYGVCGESHTMTGIVNLPININDLIIYFDFAIFKNLHVPLILGFDFLQESQAVFDTT